MKRIYLVGLSDDKKRLQLAQGKGARFGSMELPISPKLRALLREVEAERLAKRGKKLPDEELKEERARARKAEAEAERARRALEGAERAAREAQSRAAQAEKRAAEAEKSAAASEKRAEEAGLRAEQAERRAEEAEQRAAGAEKRAAEAAARVREGAPPAKGGLAPGSFERATGIGEGIHAVIRPAPKAVGAPRGRPPKPAGAEAAEGSVEAEPKEAPPETPPRPKRAKPMPEPKLTPAEIQALLRSGRGVRSVAKQAGAPVDWVRRLAAPIESERIGVVTQLMQSYVVRPRLGRSAVPIGLAIVENLRDRGVRFPERVAEDGWTAWRPDNREWRVRFSYESRGRKQRADWRFEPQTRTVYADNDLAQELGYRPPAEEDGAGPAPRGTSARKRASTKAAGRRSARR